MTSRRTIATALALAAVLVTAGCAGTLGSAQSPSASADGKSITVGASGTVETQPDAAVVHLGVTTTGEDPQAIRDELDERSSAVRDALLEMGIPDDQIRTVHYDIREDHRTRDDPDRQQYRGVHAFEVEIDDVDQVGAAIDAAVDAGATDVNRVQFTLSEETEDELREEALGVAMDNARDDATVLATNADLELAGVHSASTSRTDVRPYNARVSAEMAAADSAGTSIDSGPVSVTATVTVTYNASTA